MGKLLNPSMFWKGTSMGSKADNKITVNKPLNLPKIPMGKELLFDVIGRRICITSPEDFQKGWIIPDQIWNESEDVKISNWRNGKNKTGDKLIDLHPQPFGDRRMYLVQCPFYNVEEEIEVEIQGKKSLKKITKYRLGKIRPTKGANFMMGVGVGVFDNTEEFPEKPKAKAPKQQLKDDDGHLLEYIDPEEEEDEVADDKSEYRSVQCFVEPKYAKELRKLSDQIVKQYPKIESCYAYVLCKPLIKSDNAKYPNPKMNLNRIVLMIED